MADQLLDQVREFVEGQIDFEGQKLVETLSTALLSVVGLISFFAGYLLQDIKLALFIALGGVALTFIVVVPAWPFYNKNPVKWLPVRGPPVISVPQNVVIDEKAI